jgi:hypothetical protein
LKAVQPDQQNAGRRRFGNAGGRRIDGGAVLAPGHKKQRSRCEGLEKVCHRLLRWRTE